MNGRLSRYLCPECYTGKYSTLEYVEQHYKLGGVPTTKDGFRCLSCLSLHTASKWKGMREDHSTNEWIQDAYSQERFDKIIRKLKKGRDYKRRK